MTIIDSIKELARCYGMVVISSMCSETGDGEPVFTVSVDDFHSAKGTLECAVTMLQGDEDSFCEWLSHDEG